MVVLLISNALFHRLASHDEAASILAIVSVSSYAVFFHVMRRRSRPRVISVRRALLPLCVAGILDGASTWNALRGASSTPKIVQAALPATIPFASLILSLACFDEDRRRASCSRPLIL